MQKPYSCTIVMSRPSILQEFVKVTNVPTIHFTFEISQSFNLCSQKNCSIHLFDTATDTIMQSTKCYRKINRFSKKKILGLSQENILMLSIRSESAKQFLSSFCPSFSVQLQVLILDINFILYFSNRNLDI